MSDPQRRSARRPCGRAGLRCGGGLADRRDDRLPHVHIERCDIGVASGAWVPSEQVILLNDTLMRSGLRSTLAHEIAHIDLAHEPAEGAWFGRRHEKDANKLAAERLIDIERLADVLRWALGPEEVADAIQVTLHLVRLRIKNLNDAEKNYIESRQWAEERGA